MFSSPGVYGTVANYIKTLHTLPAYLVSSVFYSYTDGGYLNLSTSFDMPAGSMLGLENSMGPSIAVNPDTGKLYSDYDVFTSDFINSVNPAYSYNFYFSASGIASGGPSTSNFSKSYSSGGTYTITASFTCNSVVYSSQTTAVVIAPS